MEIEKNISQDIDLIYNFGILVEVFSLLDLFSLRSVVLVCKTWSSLFKTEILWYKLCIQDGIEGKILEKIDFKPNIEMEMENIEKHYYVPKPTGLATSWKQLYFLNCCPHIPRFNHLGKTFNNTFKNTAAYKKCFACSSMNVWICLSKDCYMFGCGRTNNQHALQHFKNSNHPLSIHLRDLNLWCYSCDKYLG